MRLLERLPDLPKRLRETVTARPLLALAWRLRKPSFTASNGSLSYSSCLRAVGLQLTSLALGQACVFRRWRLLVPSAQRFFEDSGLALSRTITSNSADRNRCLRSAEQSMSSPTHHTSLTHHPLTHSPITHSPNHLSIICSSVHAWPLLSPLLSFSQIALLTAPSR